MSNWTTVILILPYLDGESFLEHCNHYLRDKEEGDYPLFSEVETTIYRKMLVGHFPYLDDEGLFGHLQRWFHPVPEYKVVDETEIPPNGFSRLMTQVNERWGIIQILLKREHDGQFWLCNISKNSIEKCGLADMPML